MIYVLTEISGELSIHSCQVDLGWAAALKRVQTPLARSIGEGPNTKPCLSHDKLPSSLSAHHSVKLLLYVKSSIFKARPGCASG